LDRRTLYWTPEQSFGNVMNLSDTLRLGRKLDGFADCLRYVADAMRGDLLPIV
jgi:hypothetical protein